MLVKDGELIAEDYQKIQSLMQKPWQKWNADDNALANQVQEEIRPLLNIICNMNDISAEIFLEKGYQYLSFLT